MANPQTHFQSAELAQWNAWSACERPRTVRLKYRFWCALLFAACVVIPSLLIAFLIVEWRANPAKQVMKSDLWSAMPFILPLLFLVVAFWISTGHKQLVSEGEVSIGEVIGVRRG